MAVLPSLFSSTSLINTGIGAGSLLYHLVGNLRLSSGSSKHAANRVRFSARVHVKNPLISSPSWSWLRLLKLAQALFLLQLSQYAIPIPAVQAATQASRSGKLIISPNPIVIGQPYTFAVESPVDVVVMAGPDDADGSQIKHTFVPNDVGSGDQVDLTFDFDTAGWVINEYRWLCSYHPTP
jgi:hypothetical protein